MNYVTGQVSMMSADSSAYFPNFISSPIQPLVWHGLFMLINIIIVAKGIEGGVEKTSKVMMPGLSSYF